MWNKSLSLFAVHDVLWDNASIHWGMGSQCTKRAGVREWLVESNLSAQNGLGVCEYVDKIQ